MDFDLATGTAILRRTPGALRAMLTGLPSSWIDATEGPETWSPLIVIGHLVQCERRDWIQRAGVDPLAGPQSALRLVDRFAQLTEGRDRSLAELLDEFTTARAGNLATLSGWKLTEEQLALRGEHPAFGLVTLRQLLSTWVAHDLGHTAQIARVMAKQYRDAVGPWRAYLPVMDR